MKDPLKKVKRIAAYSKFRRLWHNPVKYIYAIGYRAFLYPKSRKEKLVNTTLFYGKKMKIALPASTDIYLTGGKSHPSEIRLASFLINNLKEGNHFLDIGAHYGYFTLIASELVGEKGLVYAFEPSIKNFDILSQNADPLKNIIIQNQAMSDTNQAITFFEFSNLQSEYNSSIIQQFEKEKWFQDAPPSKIEVDATTIDTLVTQHLFQPDIIKIDVEGAEYAVIKGGFNYFKSNCPKIIMEYPTPERGNETHKKAINLLINMGYDFRIISEEGGLEAINDLDKYLQKEKLESDNIVFIKH